MDPLHAFREAFTPSVQTIVSDGRVPASLPPDVYPHLTLEDPREADSDHRLEVGDPSEPHLGLGSGFVILRQRAFASSPLHASISLCEYEALPTRAITKSLNPSADE